MKITSFSMTLVASSAITVAVGHDILTGGRNCGATQMITTIKVGGRTVPGCALVNKPDELYKLDPGKLELLPKIQNN